MLDVDAAVLIALVFTAGSLLCAFLLAASVISFSS